MVCWYPARHCTGTEQHNLQVNDTNFLRLFKLHNNHSKILTLTAREVEAFLDLKANFDDARTAFNARDQVDLIFEFQAYMEQQITLSQQSMAEEFNFSFLGQNAANEAGHVANMTNQLRVILQAIRIEALSYQSDHWANDLWNAMRRSGSSRVHAGGDHNRGCEGRSPRGFWLSQNDCYHAQWVHVQDVPETEINQSTPISESL